MQIKYFTKENQKEWNIFVAANAQDGGLLQSYEWGELNKSAGRKVWYVGVVDDLEIVAAALVIKYNLPAGLGYFYVPRLPVASRELLEEIDNLAKKENVIFCNIEPANNSEASKKALKAKSYKLTANFVQPRQTIIVGLNQSEEYLLKNMHQKTRYNINLAKKKNINIVNNKDEKYFENFWRLMQETGQRDNFKPHFKEYYKKLLKMSGMELFSAEYNSKIIASIMVSVFGDTAYYLHGASDYKFRGLMAPYLLQWEAMRDAKSRGCKFYDFWGVAKDKMENACFSARQRKWKMANDRWSGFTRFKLGFAPHASIVEYPGLFQKIYRPMIYMLYKIIKRISRP